ncbi:gas vesicle protein GvpO, halophile-type [Natribaculum luteum]|uniref:Gas vesicle protein GvpO, halophile-type n=1 Tax=Natribaculum luteum TaxID=1586232 RepID=A0ABD5NUM8_9EURY|nr:gas vesicle protein [Natribaculum luteum]
MAEANEQPQPERCKALTADGTRCSRPAEKDGFCYQHDERDQTVSESNTESQQATETEAEEEPDDEQQHTAADQLESDSEQTPESEEDADDQQRTAAAESETDAGSVDTTDPGDVDTSDLEADIDDGRVEGLLAVRQTVERTAAQIIGRKFDGVSEITPTEDGWRAVVEVVERSSIPDTMDVLGRYEVDLNEDGVIEGYRRIDRYRRGDTVEYESG